MSKLSLYLLIAIAVTVMIGLPTWMLGLVALFMAATVDDR